MAEKLTFVHPELRESAKMFPRLPPLNRWNLRLFRWLFNLQPKPKFPPHIHAEERHIPRQDAKHRLRLCIYKPTNLSVPAPVLLWMHGGGLVVGKADMNAHYVRYLIEALGIVIVSVDYRLAPEAPFPQPLDDCYTALQWVHANAQTLGIDASRVAVGGESAGGGLAASLVQLTQDRGEMMPAFQLLVYPMLDDHSGLRTTLEEHEWLVWTPRNNRFGWESYLGQACGSENVPPYAVPARRQDVTNFPPTWIGVGTIDLFYDEGVAYAEKLKSAGVDCELETVEGAFHGFDQFKPHLPIIQAFRQSQVDAMRKVLGGELMGFFSVTSFGR